MIFQSMLTDPTKVGVDQKLVARVVTLPSSHEKACYLCQNWSGSPVSRLPVDRLGCCLQSNDLLSANHTGINAFNIIPVLNECVSIWFCLKIYHG